MKNIALALLLLIAVVCFAADEKSLKGNDLLMKLEAEFVADVAQHGHAAFATHFAEDGVEVVDGGGFDTWETIRNQPPWPEGTTLTWTPIKAEMAASGDLGYTYGNFVYATKDIDGKVLTRRGKYASIWKKQQDGHWKVVVDMGNSSPDPKPAK